MLVGDCSRRSWLWFLVWWAFALLGTCKCKQIIWCEATYGPGGDEMNVELIVPLPGCYNGQIFFFLLEDCHRGTFCLFLQSTHHWFEVMCPYAACVHGSQQQYISISHTRADSHTWKWFQGLGGMWPSRHPSPDTEKQPPALRPQPQPRVPSQPTTSVSCFWGP